MTSRTRLKDILTISLILGALFFIFLGSRPLFVPDEGRYAEIAREMVSSKEYIIPHLNGIIYFEKPILFYWLSSLAYQLAGIHIWSVRSVNALLALLGCLLTYLTCDKLYGRRTGLIAALILGTNLLYFTMAHMVTLDLALTVFLTASLYAFLLGIRETPSRTRRLYFYAGSVAAGLAVLTKGLIGILFPALIVGLWLVLQNPLGKNNNSSFFKIKYFYLPTSLFIFLLIAAPWHIIVQRQHPEFFHFYFITQHFLRYTDSSVGHDEPVWFFIPCLLLGFLPWSLFLFQAFRMHLTALRHRVGHYRVNLFFILWTIIVFLFFSFSKSKLIPYILPLYPALAILTAQYLARFNPQKIMIGVTCTCIALLCFLIYSPKLDTRTILPLAKVLNKQLRPQDEVITYNQYYQDLPFYLGRTVSILNWKNELSFGMLHQDASTWMINDKTFWDKWHNKKQVYVVISQSEYEALKKDHPHEKITVLGKTEANLLITNHPPTTP